MYKWTDKFLGSSKAALTFLTLTGLLLSGAGSTLSIFSSYSKLVRGKSGDFIHPVWRSAPAMEEKAQDEMTPDGKPHQGQPASLVPPILSKYHNPDKGTAGLNNDFYYITVSANNNGHECPLATSTCLISSKLGRQFTLVGARPSGTG
jgi:hypothetical protein